MAITISSPVTGATVSGLTSPTYTITQDTNPSVVSKQWFVSALGGTQTGVTSHSIANPFTVSIFRPAQLKAIAAPNPVTGILTKVPMNKYKFIVRKGALPLANQTPQVARIQCEIIVPANTETYSPAELKAMISMAIGTLNQLSDQLASAVQTGSI